jgi:hypothetical protein
MNSLIILLNEIRPTVDFHHFSPFLPMFLYDFSKILAKLFKALPIFCGPMQSSTMPVSKNTDPPFLVRNFKVLARQRNWTGNWW